MNKLIFLSVFLIFTSTLSAQKADTLIAKRGIFNSAVYLNGARLNKPMLFDLYARSKAYDAEKQLKQARIMLPAGAGVSLAGLALSVKAIIGTKMTTVIDNEEYTYYKRPVENLLGGIGIMAVGICIMEYGNDKKLRSVNLYNKKKKHDALTPVLGLNEKGQLGLKLSF